MSTDFFNDCKRSKRHFFSTDCEHGIYGESRGLYLGITPRVRPRLTPRVGPRVIPRGLDLGL